jgi:hypothetical protein
MKTTSIDIEGIYRDYRFVSHEKINEVIEQGEDLRAICEELEKLNAEGIEVSRAYTIKANEVRKSYPHCKFQFVKRTLMENSEADALAILAERENQNIKNLSNEKDVEARRCERAIKAYEAIATSTIEATIDNIKVVGEYLRTQNWGTWTLPAMSVGYSASQYDCGGKTVVGFIFDESVEGHNKIAVGPARGYLEKYYHI